jgi:hypothetical protein
MRRFLRPLPPDGECVAVTPADAGVLIGASAQFVATGTFSDGTTAAVPNAVWTSSPKPQLLSLADICDLTWDNTANPMHPTFFNGGSECGIPDNNSCAFLEGQADTATMSFSDFGVTDATQPSIGPGTRVRKCWLLLPLTFYGKACKLRPWLDRKPPN